MRWRIILFVLGILVLEAAAFYGVMVLLDDGFLAVLLLFGVSALGYLQLKKAKQNLDPMRMQQYMQRPGGLAQGLVGQLAPMFAGVLILIPGFLTGLVGASLLVPQTRRLWTPLILYAVQRGMRAAAAGQFGGMPAGPGGQAPRPEDLRRMEMLLRQGGAAQFGQRRRPQGGGKKQGGKGKGSKAQGGKGKGSKAQGGTAQGGKKGAGRREEKSSKVRRRRGGEKIRDADFEVLD